VAERTLPRRGYNARVDITRLPAADLIIEGLADAQAGRITVASLLVAIGAERMRDGGLDVPSVAVDEPEIRLYEFLAESDSDSAHSRYNALIRQLVSFERALSCAA
jgi:hypothetical protein